MGSAFELKILRLHWLENTEEQIDLCAHGEVFLRIGDEIVSDEQKGNWTLSSTALYLLRSLDRNYRPGYYGQLLPCCGFSFLLGRDGEVVISSCPNGIDWTIEHFDKKVCHTSEKGTKAIIGFDDYKLQVLNFVDEVETFYNRSEPKEIPTEEMEGYNAFWKEWKELRIKYN
ncbi:MAG: hypothetical protein J0L80_16395 [Chitinophagales bacterium]|nr:hypothetical protein [Chitinophagales bacterium]